MAINKQAYPVLMADGSVYQVRQLLSSKNAKLEKSNKSGRGFFTIGLSLAPANQSGFNVCSRATDGCKAGCLFYAGQGRFDNVKRGRNAKTRLFFQDRAAFKALLFAELEHYRRAAAKKGVTLAVRLNVLSDLPWERVFPDLFTTFTDVQFYDYTKVPGRVPPANYYLTFSRSEVNEADALNEFKAGKNVAVVFSGKDIPATWHKVPVLNGDETDLRFLDRRGIVGLYAKGTGRADRSGFVVALQEVR
jgi:hypothetical protein